MLLFLVALALFLLAHVIPAIPGLRARLVERLGRRRYVAIYSIISTVLLAFLVYATLRMDYVPLWDTAPWQAWVTIILTPIGFFLLFAGLISPNPMSISVRRGDLAPGAIVGITRHPVLWGFILWSGSHLVPNGDLRTVLLFGALFLFALLGIPLSERRAKKRLGADWPGIASATSIVPLVAILQGRARLKSDIGIVLGLAVTIVLTAWLLVGGHVALFGADPLALALA